MDFLTSLEPKDWVTVFAALLGPILAVQAQKFIEQLREQRRRKTQVFEQLMATRAARLSPEHVAALNMIDLVFYGKRRLGFLRRSATEQKILDCWKEYLSHLYETVNEENSLVWSVQRDELFANLLHAMATDLGFQFDRVLLKRGSYSPMAHYNLEEEQSRLRRAVIALASGEVALKMAVESLPSDPEIMAAYKLALTGIGNSFATGKLEVSIGNAEPQQRP